MSFLNPSEASTPGPPSPPPVVWALFYENLFYAFTLTHGRSSTRVAGYHEPFDAAPTYKNWSIKMIRQFLLLGMLMVLAGCSSTFSPKTIAEKESGYTYVPIDPFPIKKVQGDGCSGVGSVPVPLYGALPDNAVRMLIERFNTSGVVTYGPAKLGAKGESYRVTVDYINADTVNVPVWISKTVQRTNKTRVSMSIFSPYADVAPFESFVPGSESYTISRTKPDESKIEHFEEFNIPVYIGIGLRVAASVDVTGSNANISGIGIIGAEAESGKLQGTLVVQTLGINGKQISAALPIQSELNRTTAQNAIVAVASIKTLLYDRETAATPRVLGFYLPFPGGKPLVNALISALSKDLVEWSHPCFIMPTGGI